MNPLLSHEFLVPFDRIRTEHVVPGIRQALGEAEAELAALTSDTGPRTYASTLQRLDDLVERLGRTIDPAAHLVMVMNTPELREAYNQVLPEFSAFFAKLPLNDRLWQAIKEFAETDEARELTGVRRRHLDKTIRNFVRAGANLPPDGKARMEQIQVELSQLHTRFADNTLDATNAFELLVTDPADLAGLPESAIEQARANAESKGQDGWRFTLQAPSYVPFLQYAENRALRETMHRAYLNRATDGERDNRPLIPRILELRREMAALVGYPDFADFRLAENMVGNGERALAFERDLTERSRPFWQREVEELVEHARAWASTR